MLNENTVLVKNTVSVHDNGEQQYWCSTRTRFQWTTWFQCTITVNSNIDAQQEHGFGEQHGFRRFWWTTRFQWTITVNSKYWCSTRTRFRWTTLFQWTITVNKMAYNASLVYLILHIIMIRCSHMDVPASITTVNQIGQKNCWPEIGLQSLRT